MHEGTIAAALIQSALEAAGQSDISSVKSVTVLVGRLHHVVPQVLQSHYRILKREHRILSRSRLIVEIAPVQITCQDCLKPSVIDQAVFSCPGCGSTSISITGGRELHLKEIEGVGSKTKKENKEGQ